jgi:hypothetical protein
MGERDSGLDRSNGFPSRRADSSHMSRRLGELSDSRTGVGCHWGLAGKTGVGVRNQSGNERDSNGGGMNMGSDDDAERISLFSIASIFYALWFTSLHRKQKMK